MFQTIFHCRIRLGEADLHHSFSVQITIGISDLLNELPQPVPVSYTHLSITKEAYIQQKAAADVKIAENDGAIQRSHVPVAYTHLREIIAS